MTALANANPLLKFLLELEGWRKRIVRRSSSTIPAGFWVERIAAAGVPCRAPWKLGSTDRGPDVGALEMAGYSKRDLDDLLKMEIAWQSPATKS